MSKANRNGLSGNIEDIKIPEEKPEKYIKTETKLVVLIDKLRSTFQGPDICAKELLIYDLRSTKI